MHAPAVSCIPDDLYVQTGKADRPFEDPRYRRDLCAFAFDEYKPEPTTISPYPSLLISPIDPADFPNSNAVMSPSAVHIDCFDAPLQTLK